MHVNIMAITDLHSSLPESHKYINRQTENLHQKNFLKRKKNGMLCGTKSL